MEDKSPGRSIANEKIIEIAKEEVPRYGEERCRNWVDGRCEEAGEPCGFSVCPLVRGLIEEG